MNQTVHTFFDFHERAEVSDLSHAAFHDAADAIALGHGCPGIIFQLLDPQRNAAIPGLDLQNHRFHFVSDLDQLGGMLHPAGPGHLRNVDQTFHARLDFHESAVVGHAHHPANDSAAGREAFS